MSVYLSVGRFGGFSLHIGGGGFRLCLGWLVVAAILVDIDEVVGDLTNARPD